MICRPLHARRLCTKTRGKKAILIFAILSSLMTGIDFVIKPIMQWSTKMLFHITIWFEYDDICFVFGLIVVVF